jgi:hypothetical protein
MNMLAILAKPTENQHHHPWTWLLLSLPLQHPQNQVLAATSKGSREHLDPQGSKEKKQQ